MKKAFLFLGLLTYFMGFSQDLDNLEFKKITFENINIPKDFRVFEDKFEGSKSIFSYKSDGANVKLNIAIADGYAALKVYTFYNSASWLFIESISFLCNDNVRKIIIAVKNKEIVNSSIQERTYTILSKEDLLFLSNILKEDNKIEVRLQGQSKVYDFKLSKKNIKAMIQTIELYNSL